MNIDLTSPESAIVAVVGVALAIVAVLTKRLLGRDIPPPMMDRLHSAISSVAKAAIKRRLTAAQTAELLFEHLFNSVPDTMAGLKPSGAVLGVLLEGKIGEEAAHLGIPDAPAVIDNVAEQVELLGSAHFDRPPQIVHGWQPTASATTTRKPNPRDS